MPLLTLFAIINAFWSSSLLMIINNKITGDPLPFLNNYDLEIYVFFIISSILLSYFFKAYMIKITLNFGKQLLLNFIDRIRISNYESFLSLGEARLRTAINDIKILEDLPEILIAFLNAVIMIVVTVSYLFWVYPKGAIAILVLLLLLCFIYLYRNKIIEKNMEKERSLDDVFMGNYNDFLHGFHKLKMSTKRSATIFYDHITKNREEAIKYKIKSQLAVLGNNLIGEYSFYFLIGVILFVLPVLFNVDQKIIAGFIVAVLFLIGPLSVFIKLIEFLIGYKIAFSRLNELDKIIGTNLSSQPIQTKKNAPPVFENLSITNMEYKYINDSGRVTFELKPVNLKIKKGEVIFICGGNGSGKSTFMNLLSGLYIPKSGELAFNNVLITDDNRANYRDMLACVFSDNYLFTENYDNFDLVPSNVQLTALLEKMALDKVIKLEISKNKIFQQLSSGQKKRLALIYSLLEDKDIYIFDEWAAEQDPEFRKYFYESIIPDLKSKGKTVIAITHDDAYYKFSDRLIKFNYGEIQERSELVS